MRDIGLRISRVITKYLDCKGPKDRSQDYWPVYTALRVAEEAINQYDDYKGGRWWTINAGDAVDPW